MGRGLLPAHTWPLFPLGLLPPLQVPPAPTGPNLQRQHWADGGPGLSRLAPRLETPVSPAALQTCPSRQSPTPGTPALGLGARRGFLRSDEGAGAGRGPQPRVLDTAGTETGSFRGKAGQGLGGGWEGPGGQVSAVDWFQDPPEGSPSDASLGGPGPSFSQGKEGPSTQGHLREPAWGMGSYWAASVSSSVTWGRRASHWQGCWWAPSSAPSCAASRGLQVTHQDPSWEGVDPPAPSPRAAWKPASLGSDACLIFR